MKFLLIGHSVVDIIHSKSETTTKPGGLFYSAVAMNSLIRKTDKAYLITAIDKKNEKLFLNIYKNFNLDFTERIEAQAIVHLTVSEDREREEAYEKFPGKLNMDAVENFNMFDGILINMITGFDISLEDLIHIRKEYNGIIYFDVHTLSRGADSEHRCSFRKIPDVEKWISNVDILQANESEILTLFTIDDELEIAQQALSLGLKCFIVTKGEKGAKVYMKKGNEIISLYEPAIGLKAENKIGCGDVFGATFFYSYLKNHDISKSLKFAVKFSGIFTTYNTSDDFKKLNHDLFERN